MTPIQPQRGKLLFDVGALLQLGHKVHFFNDLPGGNVCFAHALFADARHKAIVLVHRIKHDFRVVLVRRFCQSDFRRRGLIHKSGLELGRCHGILAHVDFHTAAGVRAAAGVYCCIFQQFIFISVFQCDFQHSVYLLKIAFQAVNIACKTTGIVV